ncbi:MAG: methyltransferase domain-containing protein [Phycisphaerales bacterium]|nr:methyltransferase domain-containing protein [Planctomycetota bacterium]MCH8507742.1 methyltransferase domain-containing protein [Phycisphaerales bacterium]
MPRVLQPELMDDPALSSADHELALRGLARINRLSLASRAHLAPLKRLAMRLGRPVRVVDVASGSGDGAVALARAAWDVGIGVDLTMTDISERAADLCRSRARACGLEADVLVLDVVESPLPEADLVTCSLFMHHLTEANAVSALDRMRAACRDGIVSVNDLRRCVWGSALAVAVPRLLTRSRVVHTDAVISARAAFTSGEMLGLAERAGMPGARVRRCYPARMTMTWDTQ